jgi:hypothetical protein
MGVRNYLIEGGSGTGKTTVAEELQRRGHHVIHGDRNFAYYGDPHTGEALEGSARDRVTDDLAWGYERWIWPVEQVRSVVADQHNPMSFFCGHSANFHHFIDLFDAVFVLEVDLDTLNRRLTARPEDEFGGRPPERELIVRLHTTKEDMPTVGARIDATRPVARIVDDILAKCGELNEEAAPR